MKVAIFFGSKSDTDKMKKAAEVLSEFGVDYKAYILSAHRAGEILKQTVEQVEKDGCEVIIAGAGLAAALPGVIAGETTLPVIGVPIKSSNSIDGWDSILSILQMPSGIPVATMALDGAKNAAILAVQILACADEQLFAKFEAFKADFASKIAKANEELAQIKDYKFKV